MARLRHLRSENTRLDTTSPPRAWYGTTHCRQKMAWALAPHRAPYTLYSSTTVVRMCDDCLPPAARLVLNCITSKTKVIVIAFL